MLKDIPGQTKASRILLGTIRKNRIPTAIIISGGIGTGKRLAAINYAKAVNCLAPVDNDSCDKCISCKKTDSGIHPDVFILEPKNDEIRIDAVREIEDKLFLKAFEGKRKIAIIDGSDKMNANAANAFLKTLEEPPDNSIIILLSSNEDSLPDTIKSRCVKINFSPLPAADCLRILSDLVPSEDLPLYINLSMGRPGIAKVRDFNDEKARFLKLYNNMLADNSKDIWTDKEQIKEWLDMAIVFLRDVVVYDITNNESDVLLGNPYRCDSMAKALSVYDMLLQIRNLQGYNLNKQITWNYTAQIMKFFSQSQTGAER